VPYITISQVPCSVSFCSSIVIMGPKTETAEERSLRYQHASRVSQDCIPAYVSVLGNSITHNFGLGYSVTCNFRLRYSVTSNFGQIADHPAFRFCRMYRDLCHRCRPPLFFRSRNSVTCNFRSRNLVSLERCLRTGEACALRGGSGGWRAGVLLASVHIGLRVIRPLCVRLLGMARRTVQNGVVSSSALPHA